MRSHQEGTSRSQQSNAGVNGKKLNLAARIVEQGARRHAFAGAVALVGRDRTIVLIKSAGFSNLYPAREKLKVGTLFDLASITKVVATAPSIMIMVERNQLDLQTRVAEILPNFSRGYKKRVRIKHLLCHTSGLPAWAPMYERPHANKASILEEICERIPLQSTPGTQANYSDLGYILLGEIVHKVTGQQLDRFAGKEIFTPLGMRNTTFNPTAHIHNFAATEFSNWRFKFVRGEVHDENASAMGGVSGHAGLFSTAHDLAAFCQMMLNGGSYRGKRVLAAETVKLMTRNHTARFGSYFGLGWRIRTQRTPDIGRKLVPGSYGHNGYTGTSVWIDPSNDTFMILLTNRVHPVREGTPEADKSVGIMMSRPTTWKQVLADFQNAVEDSIIR